MRRRLTPLLLIASLLFGLWTAAVHDPDHAGRAAHPDVCAVCAFAGAVGSGLAAAIIGLLIAATVVAPAPFAFRAPRFSRRAPIRVRGPPPILA